MLIQCSKQIKRMKIPNSLLDLLDLLLNLAEELYIA